MAIIYPIYKIWNERIFKGGTICLKHTDHSKDKTCSFKKTYEFRTRLPKNMTTGTKVYVYESKKRGGCGKVVGEFSVGEIIKCDYQFGAVPFIARFCREVLGNEDYAQKYEQAIATPLPNYKHGYVLKYALDEQSMKTIRTYRDIPPIDSYLFDKDRRENMDEAERVWIWCDEYLRLCGFYNDFGESHYGYALEIVNPILYATPKELSDFEKLNGTAVSCAPQSYVYVKDI